MEEGTVGWLEADSPEADSFPGKSGDSGYVPVVVNLSLSQTQELLRITFTGTPLVSHWYTAGV